MFHSLTLDLLLLFVKNGSDIQIEVGRCNSQRPRIIIVLRYSRGAQRAFLQQYGNNQ